MNSGETVGYTDDGRVFMTATVQVPGEEQRAQVTFMWAPSEAMQISEWLIKASKEAVRPKIIEPRIAEG